jgi:ankyrin repeat protein
MKKLAITSFLSLISILAFAHKDPWDKDKSDWTTLMKVAYDNDTVKANTLLKNGIDINEVSPRGWTALKVAIKKENILMVTYLLKHSANPNLFDKTGFTPLMEACQHSYPDIVKKLLENGANPNAKLPNGWTALMSAVGVKDGDLRIINLLINYKADVNAKRTTDGYTVLKLAEYNGDKKKIAILKQSGAK